MCRTECSRQWWSEVTSDLPPQDRARLPNLFVIGAPKSGTTTLHRVLADHPDIYMTRVKEPTFFSSQRHYQKGLDWYASEFFAVAGGEAIRGEATPWYLYSRDASRRVARDLAEHTPRVIVVLRNPVSRAYSMYWDQVAAGHESRTFEDAVAADTADPRTVATSSEIPNEALRRAYVTAGRYADFLEPWRERFDHDRLLVLIQEELIRHPEPELHRLWRFLGVPPRTTSELPRENRASEPVSRTVERALRLAERVPAPVRRTFAGVIGHERTRRMAKRIAGANRRPSGYPPLDPGVAAALGQRFQPHTSRLEDVLERSLDVWD